MPNDSTNSPSRLRPGFSPSVVRKSVQRESKLPAMCFMMTAIELVLSSRATCRLSSATCATARSAKRLLASKALIDGGHEFGGNVHETLLPFRSLYTDCRLERRSSHQHDRKRPDHHPRHPRRRRPEQPAPTRYRRVRTVKKHRLLTVAAARRRGKRSRRRMLRIVDTPIIASHLVPVRYQSPALRASGALGAMASVLRGHAFVPALGACAGLPTTPHLPPLRRGGPGGVLLPPTNQKNKCPAA